VLGIDARSVRRMQTQRVDEAHVAAVLGQLELRARLRAAGRLDQKIQTGREGPLLAVMGASMTR
jgi:hypothetical protein